MIKLSTPVYYFHTILSLFLNTSWQRICWLLKGKPFIYLLPLGLRYYVSNLMDIWTLQEVIIDQQYERFAHVPKGSTVIDIGASNGDFSIFSEKIRRAKQIHAYELHPERIMLAKKNIQLNHCQRIVLHERPALSLETVFRECKISTCDFMKIDCEGAEYQIFSKAPISLLRRINAISFEVHFFTPEMKTAYSQLKKLLLAAGFQLKEVENPVHDTIGFLYAVR